VQGAAATTVVAVRLGAAEEAPGRVDAAVVEAVVGTVGLDGDERLGAAALEVGGDQGAAGGEDEAAAGARGEGAQFGAVLEAPRHAVSAGVEAVDRSGEDVDPMQEARGLVPDRRLAELVAAVDDDRLA
jgi:hypothetical protein